MLFVHTKVAKYLTSLLICNLVQALGGILGIPWIAAGRVYVGAACTAQAALKQIGNVRRLLSLLGVSEYSHLSWSQTGPAIFTFVIAVQTFSLLFFDHERDHDWSNRTCNIVLIVSWAILLLELCIENFVLVKPEKGPYYGISTGGCWCWISPEYRIERYTTDYLFMIASAAFSFILYTLLFFRLRGNISVSAGYKISFHRRSETGRTTDQIETYLTGVAKHMLLYPVVYIFLLLPLAIARLSTFDGKPVPFVATILSAAVFMLHGFFNTILFCTTRNILPESWRG